MCHGKVPADPAASSANRNRNRWHLRNNERTFSVAALLHARLGVVLGRPGHVGALTITRRPRCAGTNLLNGHIIAIKFVRILLHTNILRPVSTLELLFTTWSLTLHRNPARAMHPNYETNIVRTEYSKVALASHRRIGTEGLHNVLYSALTFLGVHIYHYIVARAQSSTSTTLLLVY